MEAVLEAGSGSSSEGEGDEGGAVVGVLATAAGTKLMSAAKVMVTVSLSDVLWDPLTSADWDREKHTKEALVRIKRDLDAIYKDPPHGICVVPEGDDITRMHAVITGPFDTPYEGGLFHFLIRFPPTYPHISPRVKFMTTGGGRVRFNPNLYQNGKVCLSILGTWAGPAWTAAQSLLSVLVSIQSLLNEKPYHNEPGFEKEHNPGDVERYNNIIAHETLRVAVCDGLEHNTCPPDLYEVKKQTFLGFLDCYISTATELSTRLDGQPMMDPFNINKGQFDFKSIIKRIDKLQKSIASEAQ